VAEVGDFRSRLANGSCGQVGLRRRHLRLTSAFAAPGSAQSSWPSSTASRGRGLHCGPHGPTRAVHCRRTRRRRRPIHAPPLCRPCRKGAATDRERTKSALAARKAQGKRLGNPRNAPEAAAIGRGVQSAEAALFAANTLPLVEAVRATGVMDLRGIAQALNDRGVRTARGARWHVSNVKNLVDRLTEPCEFLTKPLAFIGGKNAPVRQSASRRPAGTTRSLGQAHRPPH
jgi:hypothetical protein